MCINISFKAHDYFLTLNAEVSLIWPSRFNFVKVLFLLTRYMPFVDVSLVLYCESSNVVFCQIETTKDILDQLREDISAETCRQVYTPTGCQCCSFFPEMFLLTVEQGLYCWELSLQKVRTRPQEHPFCRYQGHYSYLDRTNMGHLGKRETASHWLSIHWPCRCCASSRN